MDPVKVLVVDDEKLARERLRRMLAEESEYRVVAEAAHGKEGVEQVMNTGPDIVLLDIRMPGMDGLETARHLSRLENPPAVIFCTAYDEYALEAFEVNAIGYVLKPVRKAQLLSSLAQASRLNTAQLAAMNPEPVARTHVSANTRHGLELIALEDISHFVAEQKYVTVHFGDREAVIEDTLKNLEQEFSDRLLRVHRNCLVSMHAVEALQRSANGGSALKLLNVPEPVSVSRRHLSTVKRALKQL